jgi:hypothetical protein
MERQEKIEAIRSFPARLREKIAGLSAEQLTTAYNAPEWTIAQNVHHLADSHWNAFMRCKLVLTEDYPTVRPYDQVALAELPDGKDAHIEDSLLILEGLHARWARLFEHVTDWQKKGYHPELKADMTPDFLLGAYVNHGDGHLRQIQEVLDKMA